MDIMFIFNTHSREFDSFTSPLLQISWYLLSWKEFVVELSIHAWFIGVPSNPKHEFLSNRMKKVKNGNFLWLLVITDNAIKNIAPLANEKKNNNKIYPIGDSNLTQSFMVIGLETNRLDLLITDNKMSYLITKHFKSLDFLSFFMIFTIFKCF